MKAPRKPRASALLLLSCGAALLLRPSAWAEDFVAVSSKVSNGYVRNKLPDGSFEPETYAFKEGGYLGSRVADDSIDRMTFTSVASAIAGPLASRNYVRSGDPKTAKLLIAVYWGTSRAPAETSGATPARQELENLGPPTPGPPLDARGHPPPRGSVPLPSADAKAGAVRAEAFADKIVNEEDAMIMGYGSAKDPDLMTYRYFVVLLAYDARALLRDKKERLLWETRFSINEHRNQFDEQLKPMALGASAYFGRDSLGLRHDPVPEGRVEIGEARSLGTVPDPNSSAVIAPDGAHVAYLTRGKDGLELAIADIDRQELHSAGEVPVSNGQPRQLAWFDAGRVVIRLPSSELLAFNDQGKHIEFDPRNIDASFAGFSRAVADNDAVSQVQALVEGKLPDREVVILGSDKAQHRYLLIASNPAGVRRLFVFDQPNDLLYEIGRGVSAP